MMICRHINQLKGTIQVKRDGTPIVLLNDHYTLGSYPQIGTIASYHLTKLTQNLKGLIKIPIYRY